MGQVGPVGQSRSDVTFLEGAALVHQPGDVEENLSARKRSQTQPPHARRPVGDAQRLLHFQWDHLRKSDANGGAPTTTDETRAVAGPRASRHPGTYDRAKAFLRLLLEKS
jgi:hypothetical protein